jgi:chaperonin GroES
MRKVREAGAQHNGLEPTDDRVLIRRIEGRGGILTPNDERKSLRGIVIAVGPGKRNKHGKRIPLDVKPGDKVLFNSRWNDFGAAEHGRTLPVGADPMLHLVREGDVIGKVDNFPQSVELLPDQAHGKYSQQIEIRGPWNS